MLKLQQIQAAGLLARGYSNVETAKRCGIGRGTLYRWKARPEFQAEQASRRREAVAGVYAYLRALLQAAADQTRLAATPPSSPVVRLHAEMVSGDVVSSGSCRCSVSQ